MVKRKRDNMIEEEGLNEYDDEDEEVLEILGFNSFGSSKNKDHTSTSVEYAMEFKAKRKFSVVLNRRAKNYHKT